MATEAPHIKPEDIKAEDVDMPMAAVETPGSDDDLYEDAGDLEFYDKNATNNTFEKLWLARVPKYVWESWMKLTDRLGPDDEVQIGTLRTWNETNPDGSDRVKLRMLLQSGLPEHQILPKEYDLEVTDRAVKNHFVFSEKDLESFKARNKARADAQSAGIPTHLLRAKDGNGAPAEKPRYNRKSRYQPYYRKAIPKKTKIYGRVLYDMRCEPRDKDEETRLLANSLLEADSKAGVKVISRNKASAITNPGAAGSGSWSSNFIKNAPPVTKPKKGETVKAARIPKNQLLDMIFECFREYQYWSMKALRQRTHQPDAWLRQVVEEVCVLQKTGTFANHYTLSEAYRDKGGNESKEAAAEAAAEEDEDDEEEMEDVLPA